MESFVAFVGVAMVAMLVPGPDTFVVLRAALAGGAHAGRSAAAGSATGNLAWGFATVLGVAGVLATSPAAFNALKVVGAAYLAALGLRALFAARRGDPLSADDAGPPARLSPWPSYRAGLASDLLNVKVGLFWTALVPQFTTATGSAVMPVAMVCSMAAIVFCWLSGYAYLAARMKPLLARRRTARVVNGVVGVVLFALGLGLAYEG